MKRSELLFSILQVVIDFVMIVIAALLAYRIRHISEIQTLINKQEIYNVTQRSFLDIVIIVAIFVIILFAFEGLYRIRTTRKFSEEFFSVVKAVTIAFVIITLGFFFQREWFSSRFIIVLSWGLVILFTVSGRFIVQSVQKWLLVKHGIGHHRILLVGTGEKMKRMHNLLHTNERLGYKVVAHVDYINIKEIKKLHKNRGIDEVLVAESSMPDDLLEKLHDYCEIHDISYQFIPTSMQTTRFTMRIFEGEPIIELTHTPLEGWGKILKRAFDIITSLLLILLFSPIMITIAIVMKLSDRGPIIYKSERMMDSGHKFYAYKFRYMKWKYCIHPDNPNINEAKRYEKELIKKYNTRKGALYKIKDDPRRSAFGSFIERYSMDELPQFFNVLFGDMSLVGPRPHQEREVSKYREYHRRLLTIKPGITGMAQVSGRSDLDFEDEYKLDVYYIENWSLWLDIKILLRTPGALLGRRKNNTEE